MASLHQVGIKTETTVGTAVTPDKFYEFNSESLTFNQEYIESAGIRKGRNTLTKRRPGRKGVEGDIVMELVNKGQGTWWKHALGSVTTSTPGGATNARDHLCKVASLLGDSLTIQVGREDYAGSVQPFTYSGCKINSWEVSAEADGIPTASFSIDGMNETTATALASASYPSDIEPYVFTEGAVELDGNAYEVRSFTLSGDNSLETDRYRIGSGVKKEQLAQEFRRWEGSMTIDFSGLTDYNRYIAQTQVPFQATFTSADEIESGFNYALTIELPAIEFNGTTPTVDSLAAPVIELPFVVIDTGDSDGPVQVTVRDDQASAA